MNDLIERQAAIDVLNIGAELLRRVLDDTDVVDHERQKYEWGLGLIESYIADLKDLSSVQPMRWIPCKERLPEVGKPILMCDIDGDIYVGHRAREHWWSVDDKVKNVTAWMPMLEPYKEEPDGH